VEAQHHIRDRTFAEDASTVHAGNAPRVRATLRNLAIGALKALGATNIAKTTRATAANPNGPSPPWASPTSPASTELDQALLNAPDPIAAASEPSHRQARPPGGSGSGPQDTVLRQALPRLRPKHGPRRDSCGRPCTTWARCRAPDTGGRLPPSAAGTPVLRIAG
jgi:hypothetical protein